MSDPTFRVIRSLGEIDPTHWNACANPDNPTGRLESTWQAPDSTREALESECEPAESKSQKERYNPFITHEFLHALETSGSTGAAAGWAPAHGLVEDAAGRLIAAAPAYVKSHSLGEYVFDHAFADAYARAGGRYYPKLQIAAPFTPAAGRRLLVAHDALPQTRATLIAGLRRLARDIGASSIHVTFTTAEDQRALTDAGFLPRSGEQFHFLNRGYRDFDDFLGQLASRKRKAIRRERKEALAAGIEVELLTGAAITQAHWDAFFAFYMETGSRKWGRPYLTRAFFFHIGAAMADRILLVMARRAGRYIAGAINFIGDDALYGRNWGAIEHHPFLHFELCYYRAVDFAIARGLKRVEAGAQGEHKLARGYEPVATFSAHEFADPRLSRAVADYLEHERAHIAREIEALGQYTPFRKG